MVSFVTHQCIRNCSKALVTVCKASKLDWCCSRDVLDVLCRYVAPLLVAATFTGAVKQLLEVRKFSAWVTPASGALLLAGGTYGLLSRVVPAWAWMQALTAAFCHNFQRLIIDLPESASVSRNVQSFLHIPAAWMSMMAKLNLRKSWVDLQPKTLCRVSLMDICSGEHLPKHRSFWSSFFRWAPLEQWPPKVTVDLNLLESWAVKAWSQTVAFVSCHRYQACARSDCCRGKHST